MDKSIAVLARTNRGLRVIEEVLTEAGVKYHLVGGSGYWTSEEVKSAISWLSAVVYPANHILAGVLRTSFHPTKFLPKSKILARFKELKETDPEVSYWKVLTTEPQTLVEQKNLSSLRDFVSFVHGLSRYRDLPAADALKSVYNVLKVGDFYAEGEFQIDSDPLENLAELLKLAGRYKTVKEFLDFCRRATAASKSKKGVALATAHAAKGLEWHTVHIVGCQAEMMPHKKATDLEEERNIFFVACSRAERELFITFSGEPSPFLQDCGIMPVRGEE